MILVPQTYLSNTIIYYFMERLFLFLSGYKSTVQLLFMDMLLWCLPAQNTTYNALLSTGIVNNSVKSQVCRPSLANPDWSKPSVWFSDFLYWTMVNLMIPSANL